MGSTLGAILTILYLLKPASLVICSSKIQREKNKGFYNEDFEILNMLLLETFVHIQFSTLGNFSEDMSCLHNKLMMIRISYQRENESSIYCL